MLIELNINTKALRQLISLTEGNPELTEISTQLQSALSQSDDNQTDEIPQEGDNERIERME